MPRWPLILVLTSVTVVGLYVAVCKAGLADDKPLQRPPGWKADEPLPRANTNCVRCHLTAGRELTAPVRDFARSAHDRARLSCNDCHGGNTDDDTTAHGESHGFIGTKLSSHMAACAECHPHEAQSFKKSKHYWDLSKRQNRDYPTCSDCHGNHDVGRPPAEFALNNVCTDCHKQLAKDWADTAAVVAANDKLWQVLRRVHTKNKTQEDPTPEPFRDELYRVRAHSARLMHAGRPVTANEAKALNERTRKLTDALEGWLAK